MQQEQQEQEQQQRTAILNNHSPASNTSLNTDLCKLSEQERKKETEKRIQKLDYEFYKFVNVDLTFDVLKLNKIHIDYVFNYWKLKRRYRQNKPLLIPKAEEDLMNQSERLLNARIKMFIHLRQDLERVRNLCYMVIKREKLKKRYFQLKTNIFYKQSEFIQKYGSERSGRTKDILSTKHVNCIYDYLNLSQCENDGFQKVIDEYDDDFNDDAVSAEPTTVDNSLEKIKNLEKEIENLKDLNNSPPINSTIEQEKVEEKREEMTTIKNNKFFKSSTNLVTRSSSTNKKKSITNQIKTKYKNIQINNLLTQTPNNNNNKNGGYCNNIEEKSVNQFKRRSTSDYETFKQLNNDLKFTRNGFFNNKKLKVTDESNNSTTESPSTTPTRMRLSLRSSKSASKAATSACKPPVLRSPSIKRSNSRQDLSNFNQNRVTRLTFENGSF